MQFFCPGKIFIIGEYACIEGGPAIVCTAGPDFGLSLVPGGTSRPFDAKSPAGRLLEEKKELFTGFAIDWIDSYITPIGVGSSSAQYLLTLAAAHHLQDAPLPTGHEVLQRYWKSVGESQGLRPSGVDVVAQWLGGPLFVRNEPFFAEKLKPWSGDSVFVLAFTGKKEKTHDHLKALQERGFPESFLSTISKLNVVTNSAVEAWMRADAAKLGEALNDFQDELTHAGLAPEAFSAQLRKLQQWPGVLGCKGAGAQGGDCALLLVHQDSVRDVSRKITEMGWSPILPQWTQNGVRRASN